MYVPFNAGPNEPFGRSMLESAPLDVIRMLGVMNDFRRVLESQGWARSDFTVDTEKLKDFMPPEIIGDVEAEDAFIQDFLNGINQQYSNLAPNEGYGHLDIVTVNTPKGGQMQTSFFGLVDGLMRLYDRRVGRSTGSTPIKQHSNEVSRRAMLQSKEKITALTYRASSRPSPVCFQRSSGMCCGRRDGRGR